MSRVISLFSLLIVATAGFAADGGPAPIATPTATGTAAGATSGAAPSSGIDPTMFILIGGMILFMWLLVIRPQKKEEKRRKELIDSMKAGHHVVTIGGIHGEVQSVGEGTVDVIVGKGDKDKPVVMTFNRGAIATNITLMPEAKAATAAKK